MVDVGSVMVQIRANLSQFSSDLRQALRQLNKATDEMGDEIDDLGKKTARAASRMEGYFKDVSRIVSGIMISQAFYRTINAIEQASRTLFEFSMTLEDVRTKYEMLLGSGEEAKKYIAALEEFAANTPFDFEGVDKASQRIKSMGVETEAVLPILRTLGDAIAIMGGNSDTLERVTIAMRQMYQSPKAQAEELEQFIEAGIDASKYLREELGLTAEQVKNLGDQAISGRQAVAAILSGLSKDPRFAGGMEKLSENTRGMINTIRDNAKFLGVGIFSQVFEGLKDNIRQVRDFTNELLKAYNRFGTGGVFEKLFPPEMQSSIRVIVGSLQSLWDSLKRIFAAVKPIISAFGEAFVGALAVILPIIASLTRALAALTEWLLQNEQLVKALAFAIIGLKIASIASTWIASLVLTIKKLSIAVVVAKAIHLLRNAILGLTGVMARNPVTALIMVISAALLSLALSSKTAQKWLESLMARLAQLAGFDMGKILQPENKDDYSKWLEEYNGSLSSVIDGIKGTGEATEEATKKMKKFIASFDEVFQVPEDEGDATGGLDDVISDIEDLPDKIELPEIKEPEIPPLPDLDDLLPEFPPIIMLPELRWPPMEPFEWPKIPVFEWPKIPAFEWPKIPVFEWPEIPPVPEWPRIPVPEWPKLPDFEWPKIPAFEWPKIPVLEWPPNLPEFEWPKIPVLEWPKLPDFEWPKLPDFEWPKIPVLEWPKIPVLEWPPNLPEFEWPKIPVFEWPKIPVFEWPKIPVFEWPTLPAFHWPALPAFQWPALPAFQWPKLPEFQWPELPSLGEIFEKHKTAVILAIVGIIAVIVLAFTGGTPAILAAVVTIITRIATVFSRLGPAIMAIIRGLPQIISNIFSRAPGLIRPIVTNIGNTFKNLPTNIMTHINGIPSKVKGLFDRLPTPVRTAMTNAANVFREMPSKIMTLINNIPNKVKELFDRLPNPVRTVVDSIVGHFIGLPGRIVNAISSIPGKVAEIFSKAWEAIKGFPGAVKQSLGGLGVKFSSSGVTGFANGGIIGRDSIVRVGEKGRREAIIPLDNGAAMAPFADAVAQRLGLTMNQAGQRPSSSDTGGGLPNVLYVGTLIADDRSLRELERKMRIIRAGEQSRGVKS